MLYFHAHELDADWVAASNMAIYLADLFKDDQGQFNDTPSDPSDLICIAAAAVLCFFIKSAGHHQDLYFMQNKHPHPYVRISYFMEFFMDTFTVNLPPDVTLNLKNITKKGVRTAEQMLKHDMGNPVMDFAAVFMEYSDQIEAHIHVIMEHAESLPELCRNRTDIHF